MLAVTYDNKTYNVLVEKMNNSSSIPKQGGTHRNRIWIRNSWGVEWGVFGSCYIEINNLEKLLKQGGIACALVE